MSATLPAASDRARPSRRARCRAAGRRRPAPRTGAVGRHAVLAAGARRRAADAGAAGRHPRLAARSAPGPAIREVRPRLPRRRSEWDPVQNRYGGLVMIYGTLVTSLIALRDRGAGELRHRAVPDRAVAGLAEAPARHRDRAAGRGAVDRLRHVGPAGLRPDPVAPTCSSRCRRLFDGVPVLGALFSGPPVGIGILSAGIILAIMIIPFIASVMRDVFEVTPPMLKESAYGARLDHLGSGLEGRAAVHQDRRHRRHHARPRAARSARRWPSPS